MTAFHLGLLVGVALGMLAGFMCCCIIDIYKRGRRNNGI